MIIRGAVCILAAIAMGPTLPGAGGMGRQSVTITPGDLTSRAANDSLTASYYTMSYTIPEGLTESSVDRVILEVLVNAEAMDRNGYVNETPMLQVFALKNSFAGSIDSENIDESTRAVRPVPVGESRTVKIDITDIVRAHVGGRAGNYGLVVGSITGGREGEFTILPFPGGGMGRITYYSVRASRPQ